MTETRLTRSAYEAMAARARADYPEETCGFVFSSGDELLVVPMENIQNRLHAEDPETHPRTARRAYCFDPVEMQRVMDAHEAAERPLRCIYHSHPDEDSYFSETDSAAAAPFGEPSYPDVVHLVFSVREGKVVDLKAFDWSADEERFVEAPLVVTDAPD